MKRNLKWIWIPVIVLAVAVIAVVCAIVAALCLFPSAPDYTFAPFVDTYETPKSYTSQDPNIVFDGVLDDQAWSDQRWLQVKHNTEDFISVKMTSYFGTDGLYMAFDVDDLGIYFDEKRDAAYNSGIQLYISPMSGAKNISGCGYEISLAAGGQVKIKQYNQGSYQLYLGRAYTEAVLKGELNTDDAQGYTMEVFIDYALLGEDCKQVYANAAIVRAMSETGTERQWYSFGLNDRGASWTRAETWWTFDSQGLVAYDVTVEAGDKGTVAGKTYVPDGDDYTFCLEPSTGYYAKTVRLNGKDMTSQLYFMDGKTYGTVENVSSDLNILVDYQPIPTDVVAVSGKLSGAEGVIPGAKLWAVQGGYQKALSVDGEGNFFGEIPQGMQLFAAAEGHVPEAVNPQTGENNISLQKMYWGENTQTGRKSTDQTLWDLNRVYLDRVRMKSTEYAMELVHSEIYSKSVYASAKLKTDVKQGVDTRAGFTFYVDKDTSVFIALTMNGEVNQYNPTGKINCTVQLIAEYKGERIWGSGGITVPVENQEEIMRLAQNEGVPFAVHYNKGAFDVWVNGQQVGYGIYPKNASGFNRLSESASVAVGLQTWSSRAVYEDLQFNGNYPARLYPSAPGWDLSGLGSGVAISKTTDKWSSAMLNAKYYNKLCVTANIPLIGKSGADLRSGILLRTPQGKEVFVSLTANGEKNNNNPNGDLYYTVQVISGGYASWKVDGKILDVRTWQELKDLAANGGVPMTVYMEDGKLTIGINGYLIAEDVIPVNTDGTSFLAGNTMVSPGLVTTGTALKFTGVSVGTERPELKDPNLRGWDLSKLSDGEAIRVDKATRAEVVTWHTLRDKYYLTSQIQFPTATEDVRVGYRFSDADGNKVFAAFLQTADGSYAVQMIATPATGGFHWTWNYKLNSITSLPEGGIPFGVAYDQGAFSVWVNNTKIGENIVPAVEGTAVLSNDDLVCAGLECWSTTAQFHKLAAYDINDEPAQSVTNTEIKITEGYAQTDKYVVLSARVRSLTEVTHDWSKNVILSVSGEANWANYAFQMVYGKSSEQNLIKLNNNKGYDGETVLQEQWYNNAKLEKLFAETGIEIKIVRMDTMAYLLADMGDGFERIGVMLLPENAPTQVKLYAPKMDVRLNRIHVETGKEAAEKALQGDNPDVLINNKGAAPTVIPGDYTDANYAVLEANIKALDAITYDWNSNIIVSASGSARWADKYDMQILYGKSATQNLVKLQAATSTVDGIKVPQEQWINDSAFEKPFSEDGMNIKVIRLNTWVYLLADMGDGFQLIGKMTIPETAVTEFSVYNSKTAVQISNYSVKTGKDAALKALDGITLDVDILENAFAVPMGSTQWFLEGKVSFWSFSATDDYRLFVSSFKSEWRRMSIAYILGQTTWKGQSVAQVSGSWGSAVIPNPEKLTGGGLWTRWVRDGANLSLYVSTDREAWTYVYACDNCGTNDSIIYVFESVQKNAYISELRIRDGLPEDEMEPAPDPGVDPVLPERKIESITLKDLPDQISYRVGDTFQIIDASYEVRYDNGDVEFGTITQDMCSEVDMTQSGTQTVYVNVSYEAFEAKLSFEIEVIGDPVQYEPDIA